MATEILVNDGGAPARILPFTAGATLSGGSAVIMNSSGEIVNAGAAATNALGFMLVDATSGNNCSVITGKGVVVNAYVSGAADKGAQLQVKAVGDLRAGTDVDARVGIALHTSSAGAASLGKILLV